jgi:cbb3-type cytochrome oxidase subunit 1
VASSPIQKATTQTTKKDEELVMPRPSRWMIRLSLVYLLLGIALGSLMLAQKAYPIHPSIWMLLPIHIEITIFGWIIQLTLGTAYWILPRFLEGPPRGNNKLVFIMIGFLNLGIIFVIADSLSSFALPLDVIGRVFELLAVGLFVMLHWDRIVTYKAYG